MTSKPNILVICTDHWFGGLLGSAGHPTIKTPTLDALAQCGTRYTNAYSECPVCVPARRTLMTGTTPRTHGDRVFQQDIPMPEVPTLAQVMGDNGYQTYAVGKLHVFPQRSRIGFDDVILTEEGRNQWGLVDDYDAYLAQEGYAGQRFGHGMSNNQYVWRPWHLPEHTHETNWTAREMVRTIRRRDPTRPAFWYLSFSAPHPPLTPLRDYLDLYDTDEIDNPIIGDWAADRDALPEHLRSTQDKHRPAGFSARDVRKARRAFYAQCTHIDHQIRLVIGALREEKQLDNTLIIFTSDHGDMLGNHDLWAKRLFYEGSSNIPMLVVGPAGDPRIAAGEVAHRLVGLQDIMPTVLDVAGITPPASVEGRSMIGDNARDWLYGEYGEGANATRMVHAGRYKLIYYANGNRVQLFDLENDPSECHDLADDPALTELRTQLLDHLRDNLYGSDLDWLDADGALIGLPARETVVKPDRGLSQQRSIY